MRWSGAPTTLEQVPPPSHHRCVRPAWPIVVSDPVPPDVQTYLDGIATEHRPMWDRFEGLVRVVHPEVELLITYGMPTFVVGEHRLPVGVWKHGPRSTDWTSRTTPASSPATPGSPRAAAR